MSKQYNIKRFFGRKNGTPERTDSGANSSNTNEERPEPSLSQDMQDEADLSTESPAGGKKRKLRSFQVTWLRKYPWLRKLEEDDGMACDICIRAGSKNPFTTKEGCKNWQNTALTRHQDSHEHTQSVNKLQLRSDMEKSCKKVDSRNTELQSGKLQNYIKQMRLVYCMSKNDIASSSFADLMHVQVLNGVNCPDYYKKPEILCEFEECFQSVIEKDLLSQINASLDTF